MKLVRHTIISFALLMPLITHAELGPCKHDGLPENAKCGSVRVPTDYDDPDGEKLELNVVILPVRSGKAAPDPVISLAGGLGIAATDSARFFARNMTKFQESRDLVLFDLRGTGSSGHFACQLEPAEIRNLIYAFHASENLPDCARRLSARATLRTEVFARDIDHVRLALGAERINLIGASYGTRLALAYARLFPDRLRASSLERRARVGCKNLVRRGRDAYDADVKRSTDVYRNFTHSMSAKQEL
ncbi:MAG TPA: alpha/beta fold hydrolase [Longimicrobiales bacterium]|nr:alpha/beta fold hydrolase [Longimicrobiales bacterium]